MVLYYTPSGYAFGISLEYNIRAYILIFIGNKPILITFEAFVKPL